MPKLKHINCSIELPPSNEPLVEYHSIYTDGLVETFVAIPQEPSAFNVHVTSEGYVARGLAVFVFIDGVYQCMRFRGYLEEEHPGDDPQYTEIDFRFRQKEEKGTNEQFIAREWRFDKLNVAATDAEAHRADEIGTIEVVVLRLRGMEAPAEVQAMYGGFDGADDDDDDEDSEDGFGIAFDGPPDSRKSNRSPRDAGSYVVAPGSMAGTSADIPPARVGDLKPGDGGYYNQYRPHGRRDSPPASRIADFTARTRFRPGVVHQDGQVIWTRPRGLFAVAEETVRNSGSPRGSLASEANRRPEQDRERGWNVGTGQSGAHAVRERHVNFQDGFPQNPFAAPKPWALDINQSRRLEDYRPLWRRDQPDSDLASTATFRGYERPSFLDSKHRFDPRYANDHQLSRRGTKQKKSNEQPGATWDDGDVDQPGAWDSTRDNKSQKSKSSKDSQKSGDVNFNATGWGNIGDTGNAANDNAKDDKANTDRPDNNDVDNGGWDDNKNDHVDTSGDWNKDNGSNKDEQAAAEKSLKHRGSHKTKSREAPSSISYMHVPSIPEEPVFKSYWKDWNKRPAEQKARVHKYLESASSKDLYIAPTEVPEQVPEREARKRGLDHQVYAGKASEYRHRLGKPIYNDTMERPYAVFRFKYRTMETLEKMLGRKGVDWEKIKKREKQKKLMHLSKEELVEQLIKRTSISGKSGSVKPSVKASSAAGTPRVASWLEQQAKVPSESRPKSEASKEPITCDRCKKQMKQDEKWWHCQPCDEDICRGCNNKDNGCWCKDGAHRLERWTYTSNGGAGGNGEWIRPKTKSTHGGPQCGKSSGKSGCGSQKAKSASHHGSSRGCKNGGFQKGDTSGSKYDSWDVKDKQDISANCADFDQDGQW